MSAIASAIPASATSNTAPIFWSWAQRPVMGWNSWDCFGAGVNEEQVLANAQYMKDRLLPHGYDLITIDIQWYEPLAHTDQYRPHAVLEMDGYGRLMPAVNRFPSSREGRSFKPLDERLHAMGLKLGIHLLRGIPRQAVEKNLPILGAEKLKPGGIHAGDIADKRNVCKWNTDMYGVDMSKPGAQEYYDSVLALLASWEIDFVKVDDLSAPKYQAGEVEAIRQAIDKTGRPIVLSLSPGETPLSAGVHVEMHANQWRISNDFWDNWGALQEQFGRLDSWTPYRGPGHFPDADMLPVGAIRTWNLKDNETHFTHDELYTLMNLWCIARSPLIIGANLPANDPFTLQLLTNDELIAVDQHSANNRQLWHKGDLFAWAADAEGSGDKYVALFYAPPGPVKHGQDESTRVSDAVAQTLVARVTADEIGLRRFTSVRDLWRHRDVVLEDNAVLNLPLRPHCSAIFRVSGS